MSLEHKLRVEYAERRSLIIMYEDTLLPELAENFDAHIAGEGYTTKTMEDYIETLYALQHTLARKIQNIVDNQ